MGLLDFMTMKFKHWSYTQDIDLGLYSEATSQSFSRYVYQMREL